MLLRSVLRRPVLRGLLGASLERTAAAEAGVILEANVAFAAYLGYEPEALRGRRLAHLLSYDGEPLDAGTGLPAIREATVTLRGGKRLPVEVAVRSLAFGRRTVELIVLRDVSAQLSTQSALRRYQAELERKNRELERSDRVKSEFLATISHELRTPLTSVIGYAQLLESDASLSAEQREYLRLVQASGFQLTLLVEGLIDLSRLESGELTLYRENVAFATILRSALDGARGPATAKGLSLDVVGEVPPTLYADASRLEQVLGAYLSNAVKFTPLGGRIEVSVGTDTAELRCEVRDNGVGISPDDLPHVFQPFFRVGGLEGRSENGAGLGLALARHLCELHGGRVWAESTVGAGSRFGFAVPLNAAAEGPSLRPVTGEAGPS